MEGKHYVGFNGNGGVKRARLQGRGYRLLGDKGWLVRARYAHLGEADDAWRAVRDFFNDMQYVEVLFGLVVAGRHLRTGEWLSLADLQERTRTAAGRKWLDGSAVRIYTEEDYLFRWRKIVAERMAFSVIPDRDQEKSVENTPSSSAVQMLAYLSKNAISQKALAGELGISKSHLSQYMNGRRMWTREWQERLEGVDCQKIERMN